MKNLVEKRKGKREWFISVGRENYVCNIEKKSTHIKNAVRELYSTDPAIYTDFHKLAPSTLSACVKETVKDTLEYKGCVFYKIVFTGLCDDEYMVSQTVAYFCLNQLQGRDADMYGWFIHPRFRNDDFFNYFFMFISKLSLTDSVVTGTFKHNVRACNFLEKRGFKATDMFHLGENLYGVMYKILDIDNAIIPTF